MHNTLLIVETNTGPISSGSKWVSISPRLGKLTIRSQLYIRIIVIVNSDLYSCWGTGISQHLFLKTSWNSTVLRYQQELYFWLARPSAN